MMKRRYIFILLLGLLLPICSMPAHAQKRKNVQEEIRRGGRNNGRGVQDKRIVKGGGKINGPKVTYRGNKNRGNGLMGSGGMNYRYNKYTGLYNDLRSMNKNLFGV